MLEAFDRRLRGGVLGLILAGLAACGGEGDAATADASAARPAPVMAPGSQPARGTAWVIFETAEGADTVVAEVAQTDEERAQGLMYREELGENEGMIFVFQDLAVRSFWMQNTYIPLDIAFMDQQFRILNIEQMEPMTMDSHASRGPAAYALETNQGWFAARGIGPGAVPRVEFRQ
jgi:uncharacterized membrane protein (UPF0127 family)